MFHIGTKRKRGQFTSSTYSEVLGITFIILNEQMPTPFGVNYLLQFLIINPFNSPIVRIQESKSGCSSYMSFTKYLSYSIGMRG